MADVLVVADDLTGANATGAGFARAGLRAVTVGTGQRWDVVAEFHARFDVVVVSTESRHSPQQEAAARVGAAVRAGWPVSLVCKRVDTTLRGNVGAETAAALREVAELSGRRAVALCAPAHPLAGRFTVEGHQLLHGVRLEQTELARDPRNPSRTSSVSEVLREQSELVCAHLGLATVTGPEEDLRRALAQHLAAGVDVVIADAVTEEHLQRAARAAAALAAENNSLVWVSVDPGPGSLALAAALGLTHPADTGSPLLAVAGSATALTRSQLQRLVGERAVRVVRPTPERGSAAVPDVDVTSAALDDALADAAPGEVVLLATALEEADVVPMDDDTGTRLPGALGRVVRRVLENRPVDGVYTTGGDVTAAVLAELGARGLEVEDEVVPLAVSGSLVGGAWDGLPMVTKGGLVGDAGTALACLDHLAQTVRTRRLRVRAAGARTPT